MEEKVLHPKIYTEGDKERFIIEGECEAYLSIFKKFEPFVDMMITRALIRYGKVHPAITSQDPERDPTKTNIS
jgi:hypothetical protein